MAVYLANQIILGLQYNTVIDRKPELKSAIDAYLMQCGRDDLIN